MGHGEGAGEREVQRERHTHRHWGRVQVGMHLRAGEERSLEERRADGNLAGV